MPKNMNDDVRIEIRNPSGRDRNDRPREVTVKVKRSTRRSSGPLELKTEDLSKVSRMTQNYAYENPAFVGSTRSEHRVQARIQLEPPIDTKQCPHCNRERWRRVDGSSSSHLVSRVYREQYCVCSRWPLAKKVLAVAVGLLFGAAVGLTLSMTLRDPDSGLIDFPLLRSNPVPD